MTDHRFCWKMVIGWAAGLIGTIAVLVLLVSNGWLVKSDAVIIGALVVLLDAVGISLIYWRSRHHH